MNPWHMTTHHFGWYTFDYCDSEGCDDPTHTAPESGPERESALEQSKAREYEKAATRHAARQVKL
jgi:hypothetical protein